MKPFSAAVVLLALIALPAAVHAQSTGPVQPALAAVTAVKPRMKGVQAVHPAGARSVPSVPRVAGVKKPRAADRPKTPRAVPAPARVP